MPDIKDNMKSNTESQKSSFAKFVPSSSALYESGVRVSVTSAAVASILFPFELYMTRLQTSSVAKSGLGLSAMFSLPAIRPLVRGFCAANQASLMKNSVMANRSHISRKVDSVVSESEVSEIAVAEKKEKGITTSYKGILATTAVISTLDTSVTNYLSNIRVLTAVGLDPKFTLAQKFKLAKQGFACRYSKNFTVTLGCIGASTILRDMIDPTVPAETNPFLNNAITSTLAGFAVAPISSVQDVLYKNKIVKLDPATMTSPSYPKVARDLYQSGGWRMFFRGTAVKGVYGTLAFLVVNYTSDLMDKHMFAEKKESSVSQHGIFAAKKETTKAGVVAEVGVPTAENKEDATEVAPRASQP